MDHVFSWKPKGAFNSKLKPLCAGFLNSIKLSEYTVSIKFDKDILTAEQNNYLTNVVNIYIVYDLDAWPKNPTDNLKVNNCLFEATNIIKNSDKEKYVYGGYRITFDSAGSWTFDFARNVIIFGIDNSSLSYSDNHKNIFLILGPTCSISGSFGSSEKSLVLI